MSKALPNYFPNRIQKGLFTGLNVPQTIVPQSIPPVEVEDCKDCESTETVEDTQENNTEGQPYFFNRKNMVQIRKQK